MTAPPARLGIKQFRNEGCISYFFFDRESGEAVVIDPNLAVMDEYREFIVENRLKPISVLDTHLHADHFSATHLFRSEYGVEIGMSGKTASERPTRKLAHGEKIRVGSLELETLLTPGHTPDSACYAGAGLVFTGDTLLIGASGRTDFAGASPEAQWASIHEIIGALNDSTVVLPGHDYNDLLFSTVGTEKRRNPHWKIATQAEFVALKREESIPTPDAQVRKRVEFNSQKNPAPVDGAQSGFVTACGVANQEFAGIATINVEKYEHKLKEHAPDAGFIDVREPDEFGAGHIPGVKNVPLSELCAHVQELSGKRRLYFSCQSGRRSSFATKTFNYLGHGDCVNVMGGYKAWTQAGLPVEA